MIGLFSDKDTHEMINNLSYFINFRKRKFESISRIDGIHIFFVFFTRVDGLEIQWSCQKSSPWCYIQRGVDEATGSYKHLLVTFLHL